MKSELGAIPRNSLGPVLSTGHAGFKMVWPALFLEFLNVEVVGYSLPPEEGVCNEKNAKFGT